MTVGHKVGWVGLLFAAGAASAAENSVAFHTTAGLAVDRGGGNVGVGLLVPVGRHFEFAADLEYSPWFDLSSGAAAAGTLNLYSSFGVVWGRPGGFELQSSLRAGASLLLFDAPGARAGSLGLYGGLSVLRVTIPISRALAFEVSPELILTAPSLGGVPLVYRQYRITVGLQWMPWARERG